MDASNDIMIRISPNEGKITVEEDAQGVFSRAYFFVEAYCFSKVKISPSRSIAMVLPS